MLQYIRERAQGIFAWLIVGFIILTFALWGIQEYLNAGQDAPVAEINGTGISKDRLQFEIAQKRQQMQNILGDNFRPEMFNESAVKKSILDSLIEQELLVQTTTDAGMYIADEQVAAIVRSIPAFQVEGKFSPDAYKNALRAQGYSEQGFETELRRELLTNQFRAAVTETAFVTPAERDGYARLQNQLRDVGYLTIPVAKYKPDVLVTDDEIRNRYESDKQAYMEPEKVRVAYVELTTAALADKVTVSEEDVRGYYDTHRDEFGAPEERRARHILFAVPAGADDKAVAEARKKADETLTKIRAGADFATTAQSLSQDPGSAKQGGDLGWFSRGVMDAAFEQAVFSLAKGEVSAPVQSAFGFHIIRVDDIRASAVKPYDEVRETVRVKLGEEKAQARFYELAEQLGNLAYEHPESLAPVAEQLKLEIKHSDYFPRTGGMAPFSNPKVLETVFSNEVLETGNNSEPIDISSDALMVVRIEDRQPAAVRPLAEVKDQIAGHLRDKKARSAAESAASMAAKALTIASNDPLVYAKNNGFEWKRVELKRTEATLPRTAVQSAFKMARPGKEAPRSERIELPSGDQGVVLVYAVKEGDATPDPSATNMLQRTSAEALYRGVMDTLRNQAKISIREEQM